jgi:hypothetical protein
LLRVILGPAPARSHRYSRYYEENFYLPHTYNVIRRSQAR